MAEQLLALVAALQEDLVLIGGVFALIGIGILVMYQQGYFKQITKVTKGKK